MMELLAVRDLCKKYDAFALRDVSFAIGEGKITGFIGRNGAGKTTTLKSLLNLLHPDSGEVRFFGEEFNANEWEIKQKIGFASGGVNYYAKKKLRTITDVTRRFYREWDEGAYRNYMEMFALGENKMPDELSEGMKVKYSLVLALSHHARLLILDEPTSGLDPVSRDELLDVFMDLVDREQISILFSTHITSDLDKCADDIIYIKNGEIIAGMDMKAFVSEYRLAFFDREPAQEERSVLVGCKREREGYSALVKTADAAGIRAAKISEADLEAIMIHIERA